MANEIRERAKAFLDQVPLDQRITSDGPTAARSLPDPSTILLNYAFSRSDLSCLIVSGKVQVKIGLWLPSFYAANIFDIVRTKHRFSGLSTVNNWHQEGEGQR